VRHAALLQKFAQMDVPDEVYHWLIDYFASQSHYATYGSSTSSLCQISSSIVQGSPIGPVTFVVNATDLRAATPRNQKCKYADNTYIIIQAANHHSRSAELDHVQHWTKTKKSDAKQSQILRNYSDTWPP